MSASVLMTLRWDRAAIADGEWWHLVTGHFVHLDVLHAALNLAGAVFVFALFHREMTLRRWCLLVVVAIGVIDAGLWWLTRLDWYVGLSGVVHAMAAAGLVRPLIVRDLVAWAVGILGLCKILYEQLIGALPFANWADITTPVSVVTEVHALGAAAGLAFGLGCRLLVRAPESVRA